MILVAIYADFPIDKTGVYSTAKGILSNYDEEFIVFSNQNISFLDKEILDITKIYSYTNVKVLSFTHVECSLIKNIYEKFPDSYFHVGDWPINYMNSLILNNKIIRGVIGKLKSYLKLLKLERSINLIFVNESDTENAIRYGFYNSITLNIGVNLPSIELSRCINTNLFCFTGNFRYEPNKLAAIELIELFKKRFDSKVLLLAGFYANDFSIYQSPNIEIYDNVPNMIDFLAEKRPIYLSPVKLGAGSKNKILEALVTGCPVYASKESLDNTLSQIELIKNFSDIKELNFIIENINLEKHNDLARLIKEERSWSVITNKIKELLN